MIMICDVTTVGNRCRVPLRVALIIYIYVYCMLLYVSILYK